MTGTLSKPFDNPLATLRDLGLVSAFIGETVGPDRENSPPVSKRARYARWTFASRVGELIADLAEYAGNETPAENANDSKRLFLYSDHPSDTLTDLIAVTGMVADFQRNADMQDYPETVNKAAAIILDWIADSLEEMKDSGVRYVTETEKAKIAERQAMSAQRIIEATKARKARELQAAFDQMKWDNRQKEAS